MPRYGKYGGVMMAGTRLRPSEWDSIMACWGHPDSTALRLSLAFDSISVVS